MNTPFQRSKLSHWIFVLSTSISLAACNSNNSNDDTTITDQGTDTENPVNSQSVKLVPGQSAEQLEQYLKGALTSSAAKTESETDDLIELDLGTVAEDAFDAAPESATTDTSSNSEFTETNTQVLGVDESDLVKYDGEHIYLASNQSYWEGEVIAFDTLASDAITNSISEEESIEPAIPVDSDTGDFAPFPEYKSNASIRILKTENGEIPSATEIASIEFDENQGTITGMYLRNASDDQNPVLAVLSNSNNYGWDTWYYYDSWSNSKTFLTLYDITTPDNSQTTNTIEIEGSLIDSRRIDDQLYLVTRYVPDLPQWNWYAYDEDTLSRNESTLSELTLEDLLPTTTKNEGEPEALVNAENCFVPESAIEEYYSPALITITTIDLNNPSDLKSVCVAGHSSGIFSSTEALYLFNDQWNEGTIVHKFAYQEEGTAYKGTGTIPGTLGWRAPSFRLSEKDGALVAVSTVFPEVSIPTIEPIFMEDVVLETDDAIDSDATTISDEDIDSSSIYPTHTLTVLREGEDNELPTVATLPNSEQPAKIGKPNEDIYSVRYIGDRGYIVTYKKTDPLYVIDLSEVDSPEITGELHVEGYSDYLHPIGEEYLIGVGKSATVDGDMAWYQGVQVGLFDVRDLTSPQLVNQIGIGSRGSETEVSYNHKAFSFLQTDDNSYRMALPVNVHDGEQLSPWDWTRWQYNGLHLFEIDLNGSASIELTGAVTAAKATESNPYGSYAGNQRGIIHGDAIHYIYGEQVFSADWNDPENTTTAAQ